MFFCIIFSEYNRVGNLNNLPIILGILDGNEGKLNLRVYTGELEEDTLTSSNCDSQKCL